MVYGHASHDLVPVCVKCATEIGKLSSACCRIGQPSELGLILAAQDLSSDLIEEGFAFGGRCGAQPRLNGGLHAPPQTFGCGRRQTTKSV